VKGLSGLIMSAGGWVVQRWSAPHDQNPSQSHQQHGWLQHTHQWRRQHTVWRDFNTGDRSSFTCLKFWLACLTFIAYSRKSCSLVWSVFF